MVDLSKHLARAKQSIDRRQYDLALEVTQECQEVDPTNMEVYRLLVDAAKRRAREGGKKSLFGGFGFGSRDPHKALSAAVKKLARDPDVKNFVATGDAAKALADTGVNAMFDIAIFLYEEGKGSGLFNENLLWNLAHCYKDRFQKNQDADDIDKAITNLYELEKGKPSHPEAGRTAKSWQALQSMAKRNSKKDDGDFRDQLASNEGARRNKMMGRTIRTVEDAREVLAFLDKDLETSPGEKALWQKKGDIHRRINEFAEARAAFEKAQEIDSHDFVLTMRIGDTNIAELQARIQAAKKAGQDASALQQQLIALEVEEYTKRQQRQPTELSHSFNLGSRLFQMGKIDEAASNFQKALSDPKLKRQAYHYLGHCFAKKNLMDLAAQQYASCLALFEDDHSAEAKEVRYSRARVLENQGQTAEAITEYTRLVEIDLGFKDAATRLSSLRG